MAVSIPSWACVVLGSRTEGESVRVQSFRTRWLELQPFERAVSRLSESGKTEVLAAVLVAFWSFDARASAKHSWSEEEKALSDLDIKISSQLEKLCALMLERDELATKARGGPSVEQDLQGLLDLIGSEENPGAERSEFPRIVDQLLPTRKGARLWEVVAAMGSFYVRAIPANLNLSANSQWVAWIDACIAAGGSESSSIPNEFRLTDAAMAAVVTVGRDLDEDNACSEATVRAARSRGVRDI